MREVSGGQRLQAELALNKLENFGPEFEKMEKEFLRLQDLIQNGLEPGMLIRYKFHPKGDSKPGLIVEGRYGGWMPNVLNLENPGSQHDIKMSRIRGIIRNDHSQQIGELALRMIKGTFNGDAIVKFKYRKKIRTGTINSDGGSSRWNARLVDNDSKVSVIGYANIFPKITEILDRKKY